MFLSCFNHKWLSFFVRFLLFINFANAINTANDIRLRSSSPTFTTLDSLKDNFTEYDEPLGKRIVVLARHGETEWSRDNIFCGWYDSPLTEKGKLEGEKVAKLLIKGNFQFEKAYTSVLSRAQESLNIILTYIGQTNIPVASSWRLNERHYGQLTGFRKGEVVNAYGEDMTEIWRRSYDILPPAITEENKTSYHQILNNKAIKDSLAADGAAFPVHESLKTTKERIASYWDKVIRPEIQNENRVLIVAHGTVLRALIMLIEELSKEQICNVEVPTAIPFFYEFDDNMKLSKSRIFLGDPEEVKKKMAENKKIKPCTDCQQEPQLCEPVSE